jgi:ABC-type nitrate/sulfonate/bicarbonate transport system ATPase subunit
MWRLGCITCPAVSGTARVAAMLERVGLAGYEARRPQELRRRSAAAGLHWRARSSTEPHALLLDEPFSALDAPTRAALRTRSA